MVSVWKVLSHWLSHWWCLTCAFAMLCCLTGAGASGVTLVASTSQVCLSHLSFLCRLPPLPCPPEHYHPLEQPKGPKGLRTSRIHLTPFNVFHLWRCWHLRCVPDPSSLSHSASLFYPPSCIWQVANMAKNMFTKKQGWRFIYLLNHFACHAQC